MLDIRQVAEMCVELEKSYGCDCQRNKDAIKSAYGSLFTLGFKEIGGTDFYLLLDEIKSKNRDESLPVQYSRGKSKLFKS